MEQNNTFGGFIQGLVIFEILTLSVGLLIAIQSVTNWTVAILSTAIYLAISFFTLHIGKIIVLGVIPVSILWSQIITGIFTRPSVTNTILGILVFVVSVLINSLLLRIGRSMEIFEKVESEKENRKIQELASIEDEEEYERKRKEYFD